MPVQLDIMLRRQALNHSEELIDHRKSLPEYALWSAVTDRSFLDYIKFFDQWVLAASHFKQSAKLKKLRSNLRNRMSLELNWLRWFLFEPSSVAFNLTWIYENCLTENAKDIETIRERLLTLHLSLIHI